MAHCGVPFGRPENANSAAALANEMFVAFATFNRWRTSDGFEPLDIGVGITTGDVIAGSISSTKRMEDTIIDNSANLASCLESAKMYVPRMRGVTHMRVKGQDRRVAVFKALDFRD